MYADPEFNALLTTRSRTCSFNLQESLLEQGSGLCNEDVVAYSGNTYVVCDGATALSPDCRLSPSSGGRKAADITATAMCGNPELDLVERARSANASIWEAMHQYRVDVSRRETLWSTSFAAVQIEHGYIDWCQAGDCMIVALKEDGLAEVVTPLPAHDSPVLSLWKQIGPGVDGEIHDVLAEQIAEVRRKMNRSYGVLNGENEALDFLNSGRLVSDDVIGLILFSDGLFPPTEHPEQPFVPELFAGLYRRGGLAAVKHHVRDLQQRDPRCLRYPRFKTHDDIAALALQRATPYSGSMP